MYTYDGDAFQGVSPALHENVYVTKGAQIVGDVRADEWSSFWYNAVARGDVDYISVGKYSNVQDLVCLHVAKGYPCIIGDYVTIGHSAVVHGATVEDHVWIGMGAKILTGAHVGRGSIIAAGRWFWRTKRFRRIHSSSVCRGAWCARMTNGTTFTARRSSTKTSGRSNTICIRTRRVKNITAKRSSDHKKRISAEILFLYLTIGAAPAVWHLLFPSIRCRLCPKYFQIIKNPASAGFYLVPITVSRTGLLYALF